MSAHPFPTNSARALRFLLLGTALSLMPSVVAATGVEPGTAFSWAAFLGPFHLVFLHFPIGFLTLTGLLEFWAIVWPMEGLRRVIGASLATSVAAAVLVAGLGLLKANGDYSAEVLGLHRNLGLALVAVAALALGLHGFAGPVGRGRSWAYRVSLLSALGLLMATGHQGGTLTHGRGFLSQNSPAPLRRLMEAMEPSPAAARPTSGKEIPEGKADDGKAAAWRILEAKCLSCHGPDKQKGKFRVDQREVLLLGGTSGEPAVVPGDPAKSNLVRLLLLPRNHDDAMPPDGKEPLTGEELLVVLKWIQEGAR
jgi:mono/diheme cytochrome c family protein